MIKRIDSVLVKFLRFLVKGNTLYRVKEGLHFPDIHRVLSKRIVVVSERTGCRDTSFTCSCYPGTSHRSLYFSNIPHDGEFLVFVHDSPPRQAFVLANRTVICALTLLGLHWRVSVD